jgi:hypothetical protein
MNYLNTLRKFITIEKVSIVLFLLFFAAPFLTIPFGFNVSNITFLISAVWVLFLVIYKRLDKKTFIFLILYGLSLLPAIAIAQLNGIGLSHTIGQFEYYLKPPLFFLIGYLGISKETFRPLLLITFLFMFGSAMLYTIDLPASVSLASDRFQVLNPNDGTQKFAPDAPLHAFQEAKYPVIGRVLRNGSLFFNALDSGFAFFFMTSYFVMEFFNTKRKKQNFVLGLLSTIGLILAIVRSAMIGTAIASAIRLFQHIPSRKTRIVLLTLGTIAGLLLIFLFQDIFMKIFVTEGSATIHAENKLGAIEQITKFPFGTGLGSSGYDLDPQFEYSFYSEGSFYTNIIEHGIWFTVWYFIVGFITYVVSKKTLFPIYVGFIIASLLIPIGFATHFMLLFFSYLGAEVKSSLDN